MTSYTFMHNLHAKVFYCIPMKYQILGIVAERSRARFEVNKADICLIVTFLAEQTDLDDATR